MLTKYYLHIEDTDYELQPDDLKNWADIRCTFKRGSYDGVVRSFTSQFEFVNKAYTLIQELYLRERFNAQATISIHTINNNWIYEKQFECPLDFSTIEWENHACKVNCVDNSLAALIKANKSTKYEFGVGSDITPDSTFIFDRLPMQESATYEFTQGTTYSDVPDILVTFTNGSLPWVGNVGNEISVGQTIYYKDDQEDSAGSYLIRAEKDVTVRLEWKEAYRSDMSSGGAVSFTLKVKRGATIVKAESLFGAYRTTRSNLGTYSDPGGLPSIDSIVDKEKVYAVISGIVWYPRYGYHGSQYVWESSGKDVATYFTESRRGSCTLDLHAGDVVFLDCAVSSGDTASIRFIYSSFIFSWMGIGEVCSIPCFTPERLANIIVNRIAEDYSTRVYVEISDFDPRVENTRILAAESIRGIPGAKLYTSFNEFADWMSAVFGYVYTIGDIEESTYSSRKKFGRMVYNPGYQLEPFSSVIPAPEDILYCTNLKRFIYVDGDGGYFAAWPNSSDYNDPTTGLPRTDTIFYCINDGYCYQFYEGGDESTYLSPDRLPGSLWDEILEPCHTIYFKHRSEIMRNNAEIRKFAYCRDLKYGVDSSVIYSTVTAGYDKKDYESINGRDEFNFNNSYSTGCTVSDKTLSLLSKYRADCYGIEFAAQKRSKDTTDSTSDKDVFFVLTKSGGAGTTNVVPDRSIPIIGTISDKVFNGAFSPMACIRANAGYIGLQADDLLLAFASSTGNSNITIGDEMMSDEIILNTPIATCGNIEFTTDEADAPADENELIEVESDGFIYRGYLKEVDIKYAKQESAKYKLIVKSITPCS